MRYNISIPEFDNILTEYTDTKTNKVLTNGDYVYYIADNTTYAIRRSAIKEIHQHGNVLVSKIVLKLKNGKTIKYEDTFPSKEEAIDHAIALIEMSIEERKRKILSEEQKLKKEERLLNVLMNTKR